MEILVASNNENKIKEIKEILTEFDILSLNDVNIYIDVIEDKETFEGNAFKKADEIIKLLDKDIICIADDSGIEIDALNGFPGVKTKRFFNGNDRQRNLEILKMMKDISKENRKVSWITSIAACSKNMSFVITEKVTGTISNDVRGNNGFGFDEIFELNNGKTLAELSDNEKNDIGARKLALEKVKNKLIELYIL